MTGLRRPGAGMNPAYLARLTPAQQAFSKRAVGVKFVKEFVWVHGQHCFIFGSTGSGKTQKSYFLVSWLMHTETVIWISSGKPNETLPLFTFGKKIRIIIPKGAEIKINGDVPAPYEIIEVATPEEAWRAVKPYTWDKNRNKVYDTINIFEFRNTISDWKGDRSKWMQDLFAILARESRSGKIKKIFPCSIFIDEAQWLVTGRRITTDGKRIRTSEIVTENVLEMRSAGCRFVMMAQAYKNISPALRENLLFSLLCRGAHVEQCEQASLSYHCKLRPGPSSYKVNEGKFVYPDGSTYPNIPSINRWKFPYYPNPEGCSIKYGRLASFKVEPKEEFKDTFPEDVGIYQSRLTKPKQEPILSRWSMDAHVH